MKFEIKKKEYINKTFRITRELNDHLSQIAHQESISVNELVVQCCNYVLSNMNNKNTSNDDRKN